ncbi:MAG TPA: outer membrane beta-barrel protein [Burkholderiales bacterium]
MKCTATAVAAAALAILIATPAWSQDAGFYLGASIGQSKAKDTCDDSGAFSCDDTDTAWKIFAGYQFNRHFAVEAGYTDLGEVSLSAASATSSVRGTIELSAFELMAVGSFPVVDRFSLYGKLGLYRAETEQKLQVTLGSLTVSDNKTEKNADLTFAFGARFDITRNLGVRAEWQRYLDVGGGEIGEDDVDVLSVGLLYRF